MYGSVKLKRENILNNMSQMQNKVPEILIHVKTVAESVAICCNLSNPKGTNFVYSYCYLLLFLKGKIKI